LALNREEIFAAAVDLGAVKMELARITPKEIYDGEWAIRGFLSFCWW